MKITQEINKLAIPNKVKEQAIQICKNVGTVQHRGDKFKKFLFYCVFNAYCMLDIPQDAKILAKQTGLPYSMISEAKSFHKVENTEYCPPVMITNPADLVQQYYNIFDMDDDNTECVINMAKMICEDEVVYEYNARYIAIAIVYLYMMINKTKIFKNAFCKAVNISQPTLNTYYKIIEGIYYG